MLTIEQRVANGVSFLDRINPGWDKKINLKRLYMQRCQECIFGQLYGDFADAAKELDPESFACINTQETFLSECGFFVGRLMYQELTAEWKRVISERRAERRAMRELVESFDEESVAMPA